MTARQNVFTGPKKNIQKASFENKSDHHERLIEKAKRAGHVAHRKLFLFPLNPRKDKILHAGKAEIGIRKKLCAYSHRALTYCENCARFLTNEEIYSWEARGLDFEALVTRCF